MSLAEFDDIFMICRNWETEGIFEEVILKGLNDLSSDSLTFRLTRTNRWAEAAEKEILDLKRDGVLI